MLFQEIPLDQIRIGERSRKEIRNVESLAESIRERGLLQPIVVRRDAGRYTLVAGGRRIEAFRSLGRSRINAHVAESLNDELEALLAEGEENTERDPFTPVEAVAHAARIEAVEKQRAEERRREGQRAGGVAKARKAALPGPGSVPLDFDDNVLPGNFPGSSNAVEQPEDLEPRPVVENRSRDRIAKATGMSGRTLEKAKHVVEAAADPQAPTPVREAAQQAMKAMERTGKVDPAYRKVRDTEAALADAPLDDVLAHDLAIKRAKLRSAITSAVIQVRNSLPKLSAEHCAEAMDAEQWEDILRAQEVLDDWVDEVRALRKPTGLRLVK